MFIGYGEIAKKVSHPWPAFVVKRDTTKDEIQKQLKLHDTLVVSIPPEGNKHYITDKETLSIFSLTIIHIIHKFNKM